jgi:hypothetical protein
MQYVIVSKFPLKDAKTKPTTFDRANCMLKELRKNSPHIIHKIKQA